MAKLTLECSTCKAPMWDGRNAKTDGTQTCQRCRRAKRESGIRTCLDCEVEYPWRKSPRCIPCEKTFIIRRAEATGKSCVECGELALAGKWCRTCRSKQYRATSPKALARSKDRHKSDPTYDKQCGFCDEGFTTTDKRAKFCSKPCANWHRAGRSKCKDLVLAPKPERTSGTPEPIVLPARKGLALSAGPCGWCGTQFVGQPLSRYCSKSCSTNAAWKRKYDLRGDFNPTPTLRRFICERDNWTCQLCGKPVDPDANYRSKHYATLDHIIPQSMQLIPDHSANNLRLAHMLCNARRGNKVDVELMA